MTIKEMHYDFKKKFNKTDSQKNKNLLVPEIDWALREAEGLFIKLIAEPRLRNHLGFEVSQRNIDDIKSIVVPDETIAVTNSIVSLPQDYMFYVRAYALMSKRNCQNVKGRLHIRQYDDEFEESPFDSSSFEWRQVNAVFNQNGLQVFTDGTFNVDNVSLTYIRKPRFMHNAEDFQAGTYTLPSGVVLTGSANCELPEHTHPEIVDLAVVLASGEVQTSDLQTKLNKLSMNQIF